MKKVIEISENTALYSAKVEELVKMVDFGDIALPMVQRPVVWTDDQVRKLEDTITRGWAYGSLSLAKVEGSETLLLVDGLQRFTAIKRIYDERWEAFDGATIGEGVTEEQVAELELAANRFGEQNVLLTITDGTLTDSAELFLRLNNGTPLSKIQRSTGGMSPRVLEWARSFESGLADGVSGKLSADEAALVFAACAQNPRAASTNGEWAVKTLTAITDGEELVEPAAFIAAADNYLCAAKINGGSGLRTAMRAIPCIVGSALLENPLTVEEWLTYFAKMGEINNETARVYGAEVGKNKTRKSRVVKLSTVFESRSNGNKATCERLTAVAAIAGYVRNPEKMKKAKDKVVEDAQDVAATAAAMAEGLT